MMHQNVYVNRILNMKKIKYIGLDMDHTLIRYKSQNLETTVYKFIVENLIKHNSYPESIRSLTFNFQDAIRGLVVDSRNGNILKLSRYGAIRQSYHGTKLIKYKDQKKFYRSIYVDLGDPNYMAIDTSFSIAFCVLYGQLVDMKDRHPRQLPSYNVIATDVLNSVDQVHADGSLKTHICKDIDQFVFRDQTVVDAIKRYIDFGKKIFILTNSEYHYTDFLLEFAITPFLEEGQSWRDLFEFVITRASKPRFFYEMTRFVAINPKDGSIESTSGPIKPGIYQGGYATKLTEDLGLSGDEILYIGDHIYGDILRLKKDCNWRTALVVEELGAEVDAQHQALPIEKDIASTMLVKRKLEEACIELQTKRIEEGTSQYDADIQDLQVQISGIDKKVASLIRKQRRFYNHKWGRIFRAGAEETYFAYQVDRYACIYMEKLSDLLAHSPLTYFRANRRLLAHDINNVAVIDEDEAEVW